MEAFWFTPLESPSVYAGYGGNEKYQLPIEAGVKALPFLTGFMKNTTASRNNFGVGGVSGAETL